MKEGRLYWRRRQLSSNRARPRRKQTILLNSRQSDVGSPPDQPRLTVGSCQAGSPAEPILVSRRETHPTGRFIADPSCSANGLPRGNGQPAPAPTDPSRNSPRQDGHRDRKVEDHPAWIGDRNSEGPIPASKRLVRHPWPAAEARSERLASRHAAMRWSPGPQPPLR